MKFITMAIKQKAFPVADEGTPEIVISTNRKDRENEIIDIETLDFADYAKAGTLLVNHDASDVRTTQVGVVGGLRIDRNRNQWSLIGTLIIDPDANDGERLKRRYESGFLRAVSIRVQSKRFGVVQVDRNGYPIKSTLRELEYNDVRRYYNGNYKIMENEALIFLDNEMLETSLVTIPANGQATQKGMNNEEMEANKAFNNKTKSITITSSKILFGAEKNMLKDEKDISQDLENEKSLEVEKAGARLSKATRSKIEAAIKSLKDVLGEFEDKPEEEEKKQKEEHEDNDEKPMKDLNVNVVMPNVKELLDSVKELKEEVEKLKSEKQVNEEKDMFDEILEGTK